MNETTKRKPTMFEAQFTVWVIVAIIAVGMILQLRVEFLMVISSIVALLMSFRLGYKWSDMEQAIGKRIGNLTSTILIMWVIGMLLGAMMYSGTLPMIICYGFELINPKFLYLSSFLVCCIMSVLTGSSWTSAGTAGVACLALASGLELSLPITVGAVIAGAVFGDKLSPLSETTNLAPACAGTELYTHIKSQLWTTIPTWIICVIVYTILGLGTHIEDASLPENAVTLIEQLNQLYNWNILLIIPLVFILIAALTKKPVVPTLVIASLIAGILGVVIQGFTPSNATIAMIKGFTVDSIAPEGMEISPLATSLLNRGGMMSMASIVLICYCGFSLTTIMIHAGFLDKAIEPLMKDLNSRAKTMLTAEIAVFGIHAIAGNSYVSSVFVGNTWRKPFILNQMGRPCLSRTLEDVGTCVSCLFPWGNSGAFYYTTLGVAAWGAGGYAFYTIFPFACPIIAFILAVAGIGISKLSPEQVKEELALIEKEEGEGSSISDIA